MDRSRDAGQLSAGEKSYEGGSCDCAALGVNEHFFRGHCVRRWRIGNRACTVSRSRTPNSFILSFGIFIFNDADIPKTQSFDEGFDNF